MSTISTRPKTGQTQSRTVGLVDPHTADDSRLPQSDQVLVESCLASLSANEMADNARADRQGRLTAEHRAECDDLLVRLAALDVELADVAATIEAALQSTADATDVANATERCVAARAECRDIRKAIDALVAA